MRNHEDPTILAHTMLFARGRAGGALFGPDELSQRELARRAADRRNAPHRAQALQKAISRIERNQPPVLPPEDVEALALELGLRTGADLTNPVRWVFRHFCRKGEPIVWLDGRLPTFSSIPAAYEARGWVTGPYGHVVDVIAGAGARPIFHTELMDELARVGGPKLELLDPTAEEFRALTGFVGLAA